MSHQCGCRGAVCTDNHIRGPVVVQADAARISAGSDPLYGLSALGAVYPLLAVRTHTPTKSLKPETLHSDVLTF